MNWYRFPVHLTVRSLATGYVTWVAWVLPDRVMYHWLEPKKVSLSDSSGHIPL